MSTFDDLTTTRQTDHAIPDTLESMAESIDEGEIPLRIFNDERIHELERKRIFGRAWIFVGHESEIPDPGDYACRYVGDDQFILVRSDEGNIELFFNACPRCGATVCRSEMGSTEEFRCPNDGWRYGVDGQPRPPGNSPNRASTADAPRLHAAPQVDSYNEMLFASLDDDSPSLEEYLGGARWYLDAMTEYAKDGWEVVGVPHRFQVENDWKLAAENFAGDDYHSVMAHKSAEDADLISEVWEWGDEAGEGLRSKDIRRHVSFDGDDMGHSADIAMLGNPDYSPFFGYTDDVKELFIDENLTEMQYDIARRGLLYSGTIFPNLSWLQMGLSNRSKDNGIFTLRTWNPKGPGEMELWSWILVPRGVSEERKSELYDVAMSTFSHSGSWEQDDFAAWDGVSTAAGSVITKKHGLTMNYQMGMGGMSDAEIDDEWPGPGLALDSPYEERYARALYRRWLSELMDDR